MIRVFVTNRLLLLIAAMLFLFRALGPTAMHLWTWPCVLTISCALLFWNPRLRGILFR